MELRNFKQTEFKMKSLIRTLIRENVFGIATLMCEHNGKIYKFNINEADRVQIPHKDVLKKASTFKDKFSDKEYLMKLQKACGFVEADFDDLLVTFQGGNAKLNHSFMSLPAGVSCPFAGDCLTFYNPEDNKLYIASENNGKICYAAAKEAGQGPKGDEGAKSYRKMIYRNFYVINNGLKQGYANLADILTKSINAHELNHGIMSEIRIHEDGDFYSEEYFKAWVKTAMMNPETHFYFYTKSVSYLVNYLKHNSKLPSNFVPSISSNFNEKQKKQFEYYKALGHGKVKVAKIYNTYDDVPENVPIDKTDAYAMDPNYNGEFALVYHGTGVGGSEAAKFAYKNARDSRKEAGVEDKQYYLATVKKLRSRQGDSLNINLDY